MTKKIMAVFMAFLVVTASFPTSAASFRSFSTFRPSPVRIYKAPRIAPPKVTAPKPTAPEKAARFLSGATASPKKQAPKSVAPAIRPTHPVSSQAPASTGLPWYAWVMVWAGLRDEPDEKK
ncbi:hypothetical protein GTQ45_01885 [Pyruvatibacter mobilis]|uniref:Uncharacterized protein n=1 Tax=Pyruvatibacter mobilis TaxID=1712261 RepID=A0A845Q8S8_9HYPH|nr:hypothetical protein [Pyruvatibacter mobilis]NBG94481.1 hypothetical protein [Pyruvatibacter mobilis]QJD74002.1 hypothetical protein HG718_00435 [Pyruvatibacter mobilis]GGD03283.1 hypothetical protein GCM10011587_03760 [Pyruvatibacter mobilis]